MSVEDINLTDWTVVSIGGKDLTLFSNLSRV